MVKFTQQGEVQDGRLTLLKATIEKLPHFARCALETLSFPHWFDEKIVERLIAERELDRRIALEAMTSGGWGFVEPWSDGAFAVIEPVRSLMLDFAAAADKEYYRSRSLVFANAFEALAHDGGDIFDHAESVYHRLAGEPTRGAALMLADGITWKSEPLYAFDALERIVLGAREQHQRGFLSPPAIQYQELLGVYLPSGGTKTALDEESLLRRLMEYRSESGLFDAELRLRLGLVVLARGDTGHAVNLFTSALRLFQLIGVARGEADSVRSLGRAALRADRLEEARDFFLRARIMFDELGLKGSSAHCTKALAEAEFYRGRWVDAERLFNDALADFTNTAGHLGEANTRVVYAQLLSARMDFANAHRHIDIATNIYGKIGQRLGLANCLKNRGVILFEQANYDSAIHVLAEARILYEEWGSVSGCANCALWTAACITQLKRPEEALSLLEEAFAMFISIGDRFGQGLVLRERGIALIAAGRPREALDMAQEAVAEFAAVGNEVEAKGAGLVLGRAVVAADFPAPFTRESVHGLAEEAVTAFMAINAPLRLRDAKALLDSTHATNQLLA